MIALVSGGKDSFFNLLHCLHHGHRVVALANLFPASEHAGSRTDVQLIEPTDLLSSKLPPAQDAASVEKDMNSFMYQTVGHDIIPLYAMATGLPLYRQPILGAAVHHERDYDYAAGASTQAMLSDETESMLPLLQAIKARHPEANALCSGAILSTYQRTRVESVALRLGLMPLAFLWKYTILPPPPSVSMDDTQLLNDMAAAGLEARIIKVASAGLDEGHLWSPVTSAAGADRIKRALRKFGAVEGAALGEGGEFETIVLDGPSHLFKKRITVPDCGRKIINEGGGSTWLMLRGAELEEKSRALEPETAMAIRVPDLLELKFHSILNSVLDPALTQDKVLAIIESTQSSILNKARKRLDGNYSDIFRWTIVADDATDHSSIVTETIWLVDKIRQLLSQASLDASQITNTFVVLRNMSDFPSVNTEYGKLFTKANPPSRVTISCGDLLPTGCNIMIHLTVPKPQVRSERTGLHVQSRSYWAPANIGPYSQAVGIAVTAQNESVGLRTIHIAGQIPLIPATMLLPTGLAEDSLRLQIILALQHLWRIGLEMKVQFWTSAVAYFSHSSSDAAMEYNAKLAGLAWNLAHGSPENEGDDDENGPDPWDLKYNPQHMSLDVSGQGQTKTQLPDWSIFTLHQQNQPQSCVPPVFAVEVETLPRQSTVEWHAHTGISGANESCCEMLQYFDVDSPGWRTWHAVVRSSNTVEVFTTVACRILEILDDTTLDGLKEIMSAVYRGSFKRLSVEGSFSTLETPNLTYLDVSSWNNPWYEPGRDDLSSFAVIPCRSIWSSNRERLGCIALYRTSFQSST